MKYLPAVFFLLASFSVPAQEGTVPLQKGTYPVRSGYIREYPDDFFVWPVLKQRRLDFEMKNLKGEKSTLQYNSNRPYSLGVGMYLFELGFEIAVAVPLDERNREIFGESKSRDVQLNVMGKKWGADLFYQRYTGFYVEDPANPVPSNTPYLQRPDIITRNVGITVNRIFNSNRFSFRSAYNFAERQLTSAGSVIVFASFDNLLARGDSAIIGDQFVSQFGESASIIQLGSSNLGIAPGYTYSLIFKGFFINGTLVIGPANSWMKYQLENGTEESQLRVSVLVGARIALGYNGDKIFGGLTFTNQGRNSKFEDVQFSNSQSTFKILIGFRFRETGILKKRIWDIPESIFR
jgi:hypothetical protein